MSISSYSTADLHHSQQIEFWNELICKQFVQLECQTPKMSSYFGELTSWELDNIRLSKVKADPSNVLHSRYQVASGNEDVFLLHFQIEGESLNSQNGNNLLLRPGEFTLCNSTTPYAVQFSKPIEMLVLRVPALVLKKHLYATAPLNLACNMHSRDPLGTMVVNLLKEMWDSRSDLDNLNYKGSMADGLLSLLATKINGLNSGGEVAESSVRIAHMQRIKRYISQNLGNAELSPAMVANATDISERYLRTLFMNQNTTCSQYIRTLRLERVAQDLSSELDERRKILELAYRWGFNDASHFNRVFKRHFQCSPQEYRREQGARKKH